MTSTTSTTVFVSGANGFIAQHIVKQLLQQGYSVVGSVRSADKGEYLKQLTNSTKFSYEIVKDIGGIGAFDEPLKKHPEVTVFIHTASPVTFVADDVERDIIQPAIAGTKNALEAIHKYAPQITRVVITSSLGAVFGFEKYFEPEKVYDEDSWNPIDYQTSLLNPRNGYYGSKKFAELAAVEFVKSVKPKFDISFVNPSFVFGPQAYEVKDKSQLNLSAEVVNKVLKLKSTDEIPVFAGRFVDVRDVARAHIVAFTSQDTINQRLLMIESLASNEEIAYYINRHFPEINIPRGDLTKGLEQLKGSHKYDNSKTRKILGFDFISLEDSVVASVQQVLDTE
ncbi:putative NADPH-dependent methylglyoxal reductase GRP2 [Spathaspora sp. JA1]|nr:putative NADPH-dependent methylglyoxal reductase GRP2 [Spathaspora sp. JA1]